MWIGSLLAMGFAAYLGMAAYQAFKPLPPGLSVATPLREAGDIAFLVDGTYRDDTGARRFDQAIFDEVLALVGQAERLVVIDMFLFNDFAGAAEGDDFRPLSGELAGALIRRKQERPDLTAVVISDPLNTLYGGLELEHFQALREAGVSVILTDLTQQRASNPAWSGLWHLCCRWLGNNSNGGWLPNALGPGKVTLRSYLNLLNFNANHRKTLVVDHGKRWVGLVTSANPHDASSRHGNVALRFAGPTALDLLGTERAVAAMSGAGIDFPQPDAMPGMVAPASDEERALLQVLTESKIRDALLAAVASTKAGDRLDIAVFYFAHRPLVEAVMAAHRRGVSIRLLLDPNKDAFGLEKNGIPNRQVAHELHQAGIPVRWCDTQGEQCHSKLLLKTAASGESELILGSANYTRRNLDDLNLETSVRLLADRRHSAIEDAGRFFEGHWHNRDRRHSSVDYAVFADDSRLRYWQYRIMEASGLSTF
ncbi:phospholipase D family protein [Litchfieldella rifensis]|uniref:phospholipase D n=1 Tax=Litchfieldella rifensis TaxID=762643 RepID=A0ABV7LTZ9_9GAMM